MKNKKIMRLLFLFIIAFCNGGAKKSEERVQCKTAADCVFVAVGCCGPMVAVHKSLKENYDAKFDQKCRNPKNILDFAPCPAVEDSPRILGCVNQQCRALEIEDFSKNDLDSCQRLDNSELQNICYQRVAIAKQNRQACSLIRIDSVFADERISRTSCLSQIRQQRINVMREQLCRGMLANQCLEEMAVHFKDGSFCSLITDADSRLRCSGKIADASKGAESCKVFFEGAAPDRFQLFKNCVRKTALLTLDVKTCDTLWDIPSSLSYDSYGPWFACIADLAKATGNEKICEAVMTRKKSRTYESISGYTLSDCKKEVAKTTGKPNNWLSIFGL